MQIPPPDVPIVGDRVRNRGERWRVTAVDGGDDCRLVSLSGIDAHNHDVERQLLAPFDTFEPIVIKRSLRIVGRQRWRREAKDAIARHGASPILQTALTARMQLMPYQLEPVLALVQGAGSRVLIADAVGLGKTLQAGLIVAELRNRHAARRVLVLTPAGIREQWIAELAERFGLTAALLDAAAVRQRRRSRPPGVNPWAGESLAVASTDYVKRPEVLAAVTAARWDLVVVDEAHGVAAPSDRYTAVSALCRNATYVVLLTATPHNGNSGAFESLCGLGARGDQLLVFRRTRRDVGLAERRRVHQIVVRPTDAERRLHVTFRAFADAVKEESGFDDRASLLIALLRKRSLSSPFSLLQSVERRLALLDPAATALAQLPLPFDDDAEAIDDGVPAWNIAVLRDPSQERAWLLRLLDAARAAAESESKLRTLAKLLARVREPAIVFTEYRDTLAHVRATVAPHAIPLHGGLTREERLSALSRFARGGVLLATDAAGEGLNLQAASRIVINLELPWKPDATRTTDWTGRSHRTDPAGARLSSHRGRF